MQQRNRVVLVTGGGRGIGAAVARRLANDGCKVAVADIDPQTTQSTAAALPFGGHIGLELDVSDEASVHNTFEMTEAELGPVAVLICAAGKLLFQDGARASIAQTTFDTWQKTLSVNLTGAFLCAREMLRRRAKTPVNHGRIITFSSSAAQLGGYSSPAPYIAAKAGILGLTKAIAREAAPLEITANTIAPGIIDTDMVRENTNDAGSSPFKPTMIPVGRMGTPEEVADYVCFIASDASSYVTGATLDINGGYFMQ